MEVAIPDPASVRVTRLLDDIVEQGAGRSSDELLALLYDELRGLASAKLRREPSSVTLQATALVHEAFLRLGPGAEARWDNRRHFFAAASEAMRRILVERARRKKRLKHGGGAARLNVDDVDIAAAEPDVDVLAVDEALARLEKIDERRASVVKLRYFAGLTNEAVADLLDVSLRTVANDWDFARTWLRAELQRDDLAGGSSDD